MPNSLVMRFPTYDRGDAVHAAIVKWLAANHIPVEDTPWNARFIVIEPDPAQDGWPGTIEIEQFDRNVDAARFPGRKCASLITMGFVKTERWYALRAPISGFVPVVAIESVKAVVSADSSPAVAAMSKIGGGS